jgi:hypothetical protein
MTSTVTILLMTSKLVRNGSKPLRVPQLFCKLEYVRPSVDPMFTHTHTRTHVRTHSTTHVRTHSTTHTQAQISCSQLPTYTYIHMYMYMYVCMYVTVASARVKPVSVGPYYIISIYYRPKILAAKCCRESESKNLLISIGPYYYM